MAEMDSNIDKWLGNFALIRIGFLLTLVTAIFLLVAKGWINDKYFTRITQQRICHNIAGIWDIKHAECENVIFSLEMFTDTCENSGGVYEGCLSPCRNSSIEIQDSCTSACVHVCKY